MKNRRATGLNRQEPTQIYNKIEEKNTLDFIKPKNDLEYTLPFNKNYQEINVPRQKVYTQDSYSINNATQVFNQQNSTQVFNQPAKNNFDNYNDLNYSNQDNTFVNGNTYPYSQDNFNYDYNEYMKPSTSATNYTQDDYDAQLQEEIDKKIKRENWKMAYAFANGFGSIVGILLIFILLAVLMNIYSLLRFDLREIVKFLGIK